MACAFDCQDALFVTAGLFFAARSGRFARAALAAGRRAGPERRGHFGTRSRRLRSHDVEGRIHHLAGRNPNNDQRAKRGTGGGVMRLDDQGVLPSLRYARLPASDPRHGPRSAIGRSPGKPTKCAPIGSISASAAYAPLVGSRSGGSAPSSACRMEPSRWSRRCAYPSLNVVARCTRLASSAAARSWARRLQAGTPLAIAGVLLPPKVYPWLPDIASQFPSSAPSASVAIIPPGRIDVIRLRKSTSRSTALPVRATSPTRKRSSSRSVSFSASSARERSRDPRQATQGQRQRAHGQVLHLSQFSSDVLGD